MVALTASGASTELSTGAANDIHEQRQMVQELLSANEQQNTLAEQAHELYQRAESQRET